MFIFTKKAPALAAGLTACLPGGHIMQYAPIKHYSNEIRSLVSCTEEAYEKLYQPALAHLAAFCQAMPFSKGHFNAPYGLLERQLALTAAALKLRRGKLLPKNAGTEAIAAEEAQWTYALFSISLLKDIHVVDSDRKVTLHRANGEMAGTWTPLAGPLYEKAFYYRMAWIEDVKNSNEIRETEKTKETGKAKEIKGTEGIQETQAAQAIQKLNCLKKTLPDHFEGPGLFMAALSGRIIPPTAVRFLAENATLYALWWASILHEKQGVKEEENVLEGIIKQAAEKTGIILLNNQPKDNQPIGAEEMPTEIDRFITWLAKNSKENPGHAFRMKKGFFISYPLINDFLTGMPALSKNVFLQRLNKENWLIMDNDAISHCIAPRRFEDRHVLEGLILNIDFLPPALQDMPINDNFQDNIQW